MTDKHASMRNLAFNRILAAALMGCLFGGLWAQVQAQDQLREIDEGLFVGRMTALHASVLTNVHLTVVRIDPGKYAFTLLCAKDLQKKAMSVKDWCREFDLIGGVNAGMYQADYLSNVGYMKHFTHINNSHVATKFLSAFACNPKDPQKVPARLFDLDTPVMPQIIADYNTVIQNLRLIKRPGINRWEPQNKTWSEVALAEDKDGNILFVSCRTPLDMHDFNDILLDLPLGIVCAQHLEGGPQASLYLRREHLELEEYGSHEAVFDGVDEGLNPWKIPNVLGFSKRKTEPQNRKP